MVNEEVDGDFDDEIDTLGDTLSLADELCELEDVLDRLPLGVLSVERVKYEGVWISEILEVPLTVSV